MISGKRVFITGGAGFIANGIISRLINDNEITVYDNFSRDTLTSSPYFNHPNLKIVRGDILNLASLESAIPDHEIVIHAAAIAGIDTVIKSPVKTMQVNSIGTANVLSACHAKCKKIERFLDFSTSEVFGSLAHNVAETSMAVTGPVGEARWTYAVSKLAGEHLTHAFYKQYGLPVVTVRPFNVYGPGQTGEGALASFIKNAITGKPIQINGTGSQVRAWCYVDDMVDGILLCLSKESALGESFNIGNPRAVITIFGLAETILRVTGSQSNIIFRDELSADIELRIPSITKSQELLDFKPKIDLEEGIRRTAKWISKRVVGQ